MLDGVWYLGQTIDAPLKNGRKTPVHLYSEGSDPKPFGSYADAAAMAMKFNSGHWEGQPTTGGSWTVYSMKELKGMKITNPPARPRSAAEIPDLE
ncbi:MAG: hypothetical protein HY362_04565 [Candidatus Aenigmarchaeota archaeon]|nr:hypothetical protein [Candidatus Aenigmarchaeota archaeon]